MKADNVPCMAWCRNSSYVRHAAPCAQTACAHKGDPRDVLSGIQVCGRYQITTLSTEWDTPVHLSNNLAYIHLD
jgi:hypothetical protein